MGNVHHRQTDPLNTSPSSLLLFLTLPFSYGKFAFTICTTCCVDQDGSLPLQLTPFNFLPQPLDYGGSQHPSWHMKAEAEATQELYKKVQPPDILFYCEPSMLLQHTSICKTHRLELKSLSMFVLNLWDIFELKASFVVMLLCQESNEHFGLLES